MVELINLKMKAIAFEDLSFVERLPREIIWKIFEETPDCILNFRQTSRVLKCFVDEYAVQSISPNLKLDCKMKITMQNYVYYVKRQVYDYDLMDSLRECIGCRVKEVDIVYCEHRFREISIMLKGKKFKRMVFVVATLSDYVAKYIMKFNVVHNNDHLSLIMHKVSVSDPVNILLELSSRFKSLEIKQGYIKKNDNAYLFGLKSVDWAPIILDMFSRRLDKLFMVNTWRIQLSNKDVDILKERLPNIGKKVWFATLYFFPWQPDLEYVCNDHKVKVFNGFVSIIHRSREHELTATHI
ncbi:hypothetical protein PRIPAC_87488 [Pristionchus pacificus]|uniref:Uncharacterized protein n=1 Tax=Pristionchus pacificus TaxID=54126 RepID=A0A2A6B6R2_PRIPA|nr:hypothetical protein PRIPAC_87488 [Pristionchus pacificus]|eukprot:PDM61558.1 hypothetical protein PRIPAC_51000 [Pristionchus pacificus]